MPRDSIESHIALDQFEIRIADAGFKDFYQGLMRQGDGLRDLLESKVSVGKKESLHHCPLLSLLLPGLSRVRGPMK
jgi:hypothetical protein